MKRLWLVAAIMAGCSQPGFAIYGPSLIRADRSVSSVACIESNFSHSQQIAEALPKDAEALTKDDVAAILNVLGEALTELQNTPATSDLYPARSFCIHELAPESLAANEAKSLRTVPTADVKRFESLGLEYIYYEPDGRWTLRKDPVDLRQLATMHLDSRWGREAFLMMTRLGWSEGGCIEGPNQFLEVIQHGKQFLNEFPESEVSSDVRLEMADAYATWWNLSREDANSLKNSPLYTEWLKTSRQDTTSDSPSTNVYIRGSQEAKQAAIELYREYLSSGKWPDQDVQVRLQDLIENANGSNMFEYFCAEFDD
jgi:hypothetical protein